MLNQGDGQIRRVIRIVTTGEGAETTIGLDQSLGRRRV